MITVLLASASVKVTGCAFPALLFKTIALLIDAWSTATEKVIFTTGVRFIPVYVNPLYASFTFKSEKVKDSGTTTGAAGVVFSLEQEAHKKQVKINTRIETGRLNIFRKINYRLPIPATCSSWIQKEDIIYSLLPVAEEN
jgi:hypothetical protein